MAALVLFDQGGRAFPQNATSPSICERQGRDGCSSTLKKPRHSPGRVWTLPPERRLAVGFA